MSLVVAQAAIALQQLFAPAWEWVPLNGARVYGSFYQPNVLASFIATGLALALMLFLLPGFVLVRAQYERCRQAGLLVLLVVFCALLVWVQSRAGQLGGMAVAVLFLWRFGRVFSRSCALAAGAMLLGVLLGWGVMLSGDSPVVAISHEHSNQARWTMFRDTLAMIAEKPLLGWGYGSFEYNFQHFRINQIPPTVVTEIARHPHNEILLWWVEGGVVALAGMVLIALGGLWVVRQSLRHDRVAFAARLHRAGLPTALCIALIPMAIHTQLEFPFYLSTQHFAMFLLLLAMADRLSGGVMERRPLAPVKSAVLAGVLPALALGVAVMAGFAFKGSQVIAQVERFGMEDVAGLKEMPALSRWWHQERVVFDEQVNALLTYNRTGDEQLLEDYSQWAQRYLQRRIDKNVYASLIQILQHQEQDLVAEQYRRDAVRLFPTDRLFIAMEGSNGARAVVSSHLSQEAP
ncbi:Wzy polymerase domain-containing protein [Serratia marcescens]